MYKKVSIIVPVYNSRHYLNGCIASVLKQTYTDFELLLIADGPTDGSKEICRRFACKDQRIRVFTQPHKGVSAARNVGLKAATGKYLFFLDSDDAIHPHLLEKLLRLAEKTGAVITAEAFFRISSDHFEKKVSQLSTSGEVFQDGTYRYLNHREALDHFLSDRLQGQLYAVGGKMIRRVAAHAVRFDEAILSGEDTKYMYQLLTSGADVAVLNEDKYYYREHRGSRSREWTVETCRSMYECDKYIWFQEKIKGRQVYAQRREEKIVRKIAAWHVDAHMRGEDSLRRYTEKLMKREKNYLAAGQTGWRTKLEYLLAFYCYPAYQVCHMGLFFLRCITKKR